METFISNRGQNCICANSFYFMEMKIVVKLYKFFKGKIGKILPGYRVSTKFLKLTHNNNYKCKTLVNVMNKASEKDNRKNYK